MKALDRLLRRWQLLALARVAPKTLADTGAKRLLRQVRRVARRVPAYGAILRERQIAIERIRTPADVIRHCPILGKEDLFGRFPLTELCVDGNLGPLASVLTSSGHGNRFAFGLSTARQARAATRAIDLGLEHAFQTDSNPTLLINALPMGVRFASSSVTIAETSVREDMAVALLREIAPHYAQSLLVTDPLFCKRLLEHAADVGLDWSNLKVNLILGEETFGEHFRSYVARGFGQDPQGWTRGFVGSSMGIGEIGLNLFFETRETVRLRQLAQARPEAMAEVIGRWPGRTPPLLFVHDPRRVFVEVQTPDPDGYGGLVLSTLDPSLMLPLLRYASGDRARLLDTQAMRRALYSGGFADLALPTLPMIALAGRETDVLPDGRTLLDFKDALYARPQVADQLSGAFRIEDEALGHRIHLQTRPGWRGVEQDLVDQVAPAFPPPRAGASDQVQIWDHDRFPYGRGLDYERKFTYYAPRETSPPRRPA
ncbi:hypothetical protein [Thiocystis violacea]|uniref:hypothetical protein n=1 Tax=Thiocystis violacea TaxID=13725 RepID=UPI001906FA6A|nr:hypothetical protein [Thiocystis violacea]MBK1716572.1 hypothetical protein [Thiocystis violacea]